MSDKITVTSFLEYFIMNHLTTSLQGRLRNTTLPKNKADLPLFEAVVNSIHAIEEAVDKKLLKNGQGKICIEILRLNSELGGGTGQVVGYKITDNGIGFNDINLKSFLTLDSDYKKDKGCRGIGRLLWLKAYGEVKIKSTYKNDHGNVELREFTFKINGEMDIKPILVSKSDTLTEIKLDKLDPRYYQGIHKELDTLANHLFEHCLWYFIAPGGAPNVTIYDGDSNISLEDIYNQRMLDSIPETIKIGKHEFELTHVRLNTSYSHENLVAYCAGSRLVLEKNLTNKIPGLHGRIKLPDKSADFIYNCYVTSQYLDDNVRPERTGFDIDDEIEGFLPDVDLTFKKIEATILKEISTYLDPFLAESREAGKKRVINFIDQSAPRYRSIIPRLPEEKLYVDPQISNKDLDAQLHSELAKFESEMLRTGHDLMTVPDSLNKEEYEEKLAKYLQDVTDLKKSDLANYVFHRKVIIDLFEKALNMNGNGKYSREDIIHQIIMPMIKDSTEVGFDECNLWLIDERLAFHNYLASDKTLNSMPITDSKLTKEPDILGLQVYDNPILVSDTKVSPFSTLTIVEIKRPMRNDFSSGEKDDPIEQALLYLAKIRAGKVKTVQGRPINNPENIPGFCYVLCDLTPTIIDRCIMHRATMTHDGMGYFFYHEHYNAYVEIISFDGLLKAAKERNRAFFDKLGLPTN